MADDWYIKLPRKVTAAGALIFNEAGELLIVKPNYKDTWGLPGGVVEQLESPLQGCVREIKEEIGLELPNLRLLCIDWNKIHDDKDDKLQFIFYGGTLSRELSVSIKLQESELDEFQFLPVEKALTMLTETMRQRICKCLPLIKTNATVYLENGQPPVAK